jgi:hypothetical protein
MSRANWLWGTPRIHGELLKLGIEVSQSTVAKYVVNRPGQPVQSWMTFLRNHTAGITAADLLVVPTIGFKLVYGLVLLEHGGRKFVHYAVTAHPTTAWVARQITEAFPWDTAPSYLVRDRDAVYGQVVKQRLRALAIRDRPTVLRSPWQNVYVERLIDSIRRECLDHVIVFGESDLRRILSLNASHYKEARTHPSLTKDAPISRSIKRFGRVTAEPMVGGLHHRYARILFSVRTGETQCDRCRAMPSSPSISPARWPHSWSSHFMPKKCQRARFRKAQVHLREECVSDEPRSSGLAHPF